MRCKVKVEFGWNREEKHVHWQGKLAVNKGRIVSVTPCFRGAAFTAPQEGETEFHTQLNRIVSVGEKETELDLYTAKNPNTVTPAMQGVILELEMPKEGKLTADFNGKQFEHTLGELLEGSRSPARPAMGVELADLGGEGITFKKKGVNHEKIRHRNRLGGHEREVCPDR